MTIKKNILVGMLVDIVSENDKDTQKITRGYVSKILSNADNKKGIKVELLNGEVGCIKFIPSKDDIQLENFKFYNIFFFKNKIYAVWNNIDRKYLVMNALNNGNGKVEKTILLFDDKDKATTFIKGTKYDNRNYSIREINRKKPIVENFKTLEIEYFRINAQRKLSYSRMIEWEEYFKSMR